MRLTESYNLDPGPSIKGLPTPLIAHISYYSSQNNLSLFRYCFIVPNKLHHESLHCMWTYRSPSPASVALRWLSKMATSYVQHWYWSRWLPWGSPAGPIDKLALLFMRRRRGATRPNPEQHLPACRPRVNTTAVQWSQLPIWFKSVYGTYTLNQFK